MSERVPSPESATAGRGKKLLSFVVPVFNEESNVGPVHEAISSLMASLLERYDYEIIFTDNHSTDATFGNLELLAAEDSRVRVLRFSRNFGYQRSILAGYLHSRGDASVQIDGDLQDPPELIPEFVRLWEQGYMVVYGVRRSRRESWLSNGLRKAFYRIIDFMSDDDLPHDAGDFRLVDRRIREEIGALQDGQPYLRGAIASMGFDQIGVPYDRRERERGSSKIPFRAMVGLAVDGVLNHSLAPLRLATYTGLLVSVVTLCLAVVYLVGKVAYGADWPPGFATTTVLILFSLTLNAIFLGIIGEYLGRIYRQVKRPPAVIIEKELNSTESSLPRGFDQ